MTAKAEHGRVVAALARCCLQPHSRAAQGGTKPGIWYSGTVSPAFPNTKEGKNSADQKMISPIRIVFISCGGKYAKC